MRIVNPETGAVVWHDAEPAPPALTQGRRFAPGHDLFVCRPSMRPGMAYDLATYPSDWCVA